MTFEQRKLGTIVWICHVILNLHWWQRRRTTKAQTIPYTIQLIIIVVIVRSWPRRCWVAHTVRFSSLTKKSGSIVFPVPFLLIIFTPFIFFFCNFNYIFELFIDSRHLIYPLLCVCVYARPCVNVCLVLCCVCVCICVFCVNSYVSSVYYYFINVKYCRMNYWKRMTNRFSTGSAVRELLDTLRVRLAK